MFSIALIFGFSVILAALFKKLRMPLLVGFLIAGLLTGLEYFDGETINWLKVSAKFGAAFLMYTIGLEVNFNHFKKIGWVIVWMAVLQILMFVLLSYGLLVIFHYTLVSSIIFAMTISFSSTLLVATVLRDKKQMQSLHGRVLIGVLLIQDLVVILLLFLLPFLGEGAVNITDFAYKLGVSIIILVLTAILGRFLFRRIKIYFREYNDLIFLLAIAWVLFLIAVFGHDWIKLPAELAGLIAGLSLNQIFERDRIASWFDPLKDYFLVFLFFYVGTKVNPEWLVSDWQLILVLLLIVFVCKSAIGFITAGLAGFPRKVIMNVGVGLGNMSELGFVILPLASRLNLVGERDVTTFSILILFSLILSSIVLYKTGDMCWGFCDMFKALENRKIIKPQLISNQLKGKKVLIGCHRAGWAVLRTLNNTANMVIIDFDLHVVNRLRSMGYQALYCDIGDRRFLDEIGLSQAGMIISTLPGTVDNLSLLNYLKMECGQEKKPVTIIMARDKEEVVDFYQAGADVVFDKYISVASDMVDYIQSTRKSAYLTKIRKRQQKILGNLNN